MLLEKKNYVSTITKMFIAMAVAVMLMFAVRGAINPVFAATKTTTTTTSGDIDMSDANTVMNTLIDVIGKIALYVGIAMIAWGLFQLILALRREETDNLTKHIITIAIGAVMLSFGVWGANLVNSLF